MRTVVVSFCCLLFSASALMPQGAGGLSPEWREHLRAGYGARSLTPRVRGVIAGLRSEEPGLRKRSAELAVQLLAQALADDTPEPAPFKKGYGWGLDAWWSIGTPAWGRGTRAAAWRYRLMSAVGCGGFSEATIPIVRWFIRNERPRTMPLKKRMIRVLTSSRGAAWDALRVETAVTATATSFAKVAALREIVQRDVPMDADVVRRLAHCFQPDVRALARGLAKKLGHPDPGPFDAVAAVKGPALQALLETVRPFVPYLPPADATLVVATVAGEGEQRGWLIAEDETSWTMFTAHGMRRRWPKAGRTEVTLTSRSITEEVAWVEAQRTAFPGDGCSLTGIRLRGCSLYELLLSLWLADRGDHGSVARVLLPALSMKHFPRDIDLPGLARDVLGHRQGVQMLMAFIADRRPTHTVRLARELLRHFPFGIYRPTAQRLLAEMPRHAHDFETLTLPTPEAWGALEATLSREEAIRYLATRLRLITSIVSVERWGRDDRYRYARQRRRVAGLDPALASWLDCPTIRWDGDEVINPFLQLVGVDDPSRPRRQGMKLERRDVAVLAPFLLDDVFTRSVTMIDVEQIWELVRTRELVAALIEHAAGRAMVDLKAFDAMSAEAGEAEVDRLIAWARAK